MDSFKGSFKGSFMGLIWGFYAKTKNCTLGTAPKRATMRGLIYPYYKHYSTAEWGQHLMHIPEGPSTR